MRASDSDKSLCVEESFYPIVSECLMLSRMPEDIALLLAKGGTASQ